MLKRLLVSRSECIKFNVHIKDLFDLQIELSAHWRSIHSADQRIICRSKSYLWIEKLSADQRTMCRSKFDLWIKEVLNLHTKELSTGQKITCRSKNHLQIGELSADLRIIGRSKICTSKNYLQIEELSTNWKIICKSKNIFISCWAFALLYKSIFKTKYFFLSLTWQIKTYSKIHLRKISALE